MGTTPPNNFNFSKLTSSQKKYLITQLEKGYNCDLSDLYSYTFFLNAKDKVFIFKGDENKIDMSRINLMGVYFGTFHDDRTFRLSIEGTSFLKPQTNYAIIKKEYIKTFLAAKEMKDKMFEKIERNNQFPFIIVKFEEDSIGCISGKSQPYYNYVPKSRRLEEEKVF